LFRLRQEPESFLETAPWIFKSEIELDIGVDALFQILMDDRAWEVWHPEVRNIQWKTDAPHGKGSVRTVQYSDWLSTLLLCGAVTMEELYDNFDDSGSTKSFGIKYTSIGRPTFMMYRACREEFKVEPLQDNDSNRCKFVRTVAVDPSFTSRYVFGWLVYPAMKKTFMNLCLKRLEEAILEKKLPIPLES